MTSSFCTRLIAASWAASATSPASRDPRADYPLLDFAWEASRARPLLGLADRVALERNRIVMASGMGTVDTVAREMSELFGKATRNAPRRLEVRSDPAEETPH